MNAATRMGAYHQDCIADHQLADGQLRLNEHGSGEFARFPVELPTVNSRPPSEEQYNV